MSDEPASEAPAEAVASLAPEAAKPEAPSTSLREQLLQMVPDDSKSQAADLIRALLEHTPVPASPSEKKEEESAIVRKRYDRLPFRPKVVKEEPVKREGANYGSISDD